jgi:hypothetical protein
MLPDDPVFGNWQREQATNRLLESKATGCLIGPDDVTPAWARDVRVVALCNLGAGPLKEWRLRHGTWADEIARKWNDPASERGALVYFQGALRPVKREEGKLYYRYVGLERTGYVSPDWKLDQPLAQPAAIPSQDAARS